MRKSFFLTIAAAVLLVVAAGVILAVVQRRTPWRVPKPGSRIYVPVLALHNTLPGQKDAYAMSPEFLDLLLTSLKKEGFTTISLTQFEKALLEHGPLPPRPVVLTFDDGFLDNYLFAFPILKRHRCKAAFFVPTGYVSDSAGEHISWGEGTNPAGISGMNWPELAALKKAGMDIGSHGVSHLNLTKTDDVVLQRELKQSRELLEKRLNTRVFALTYPGGRRDARVCQAAADAGYTLAFRSHGNSILLYPTNCLELTRIAVPGFSDPVRVVASLPACEW